MEEIVVIVLAAMTAFGMLLLVANFTGVFTRYVLLVVPALLTIGLLPVADFIDNPKLSKKKKWVIIGFFGTLYFALITYAIVSGLYVSKADIVFNTLNI